MHHYTQKLNGCLTIYMYTYMYMGANKTSEYNVINVRSWNDVMEPVINFFVRALPDLRITFP